MASRLGGGRRVFLRGCEAENRGCLGCAENKG